MSAPLPLTHMPQLDAVRAFAVSAVLIHHLFPMVRSVIGGLGGFIGVKLFFVLSGFLITRILLDGRSAAAAVGPWHVARQFYIRRSLRIFPLYYFVIGLAFLLALPPVREEVWWLLSYTFNFRIAATGLWPANISHFWTLAVEEQFYLVWPWVILLLPRRCLAPVTIAIILIGPAYRLLALQLGFNSVAFYAATFSSFDALGGGALLAILSSQSDARTRIQRVCRLYLLPIGLGLFAILQLGDKLSVLGHSLFLVFIDSAIVLISVGLISSAATGFTGTVGRVLDAGPLRYCGRISYGLYVYHLILYGVVYDLGVSLGLDWQDGDYLHGAAALVATFLVAALSWHLLERPLNALKDRFTYKDPAAIPASRLQATVPAA
jgi:peptidoglycan/LPS O-acetylase OafA/YrhL